MYNGVYNKDAFAYQYDIVCKWLKKQIGGGNLSAVLSERGVSQVCVYGIAGLGEFVIADLTNGGTHIVCLSDARFDDYSGAYCGIPVVPPSNIPQSIDAVVVTAEFYFREIMDSLVLRGFSLDKIISLAMLVE